MRDSRFKRARTEFERAAPTFAAPTFAAPTFAAPTFAAPTFAAPIFAALLGMAGLAACSKPSPAPAGADSPLSASAMPSATSATSALPGVTPSASAMPNAANADQSPPLAAAALYDETTTHIRAKAGTHFSLLLPANVTTPMKWRIAPAPDAAIVSLGAQSYSATPPAECPRCVGYPGTRRFDFDARAPGKQTLHLSYGSLTDAKAQPEKELSVDVVVVE